MAFLRKLRIKESDCKALEKRCEKNGLLHTIYSQNGDHYTGEWKDDLRHGKGTQVWKKARTMYIGSWKQDQRHGYGTLYKLQSSTQEYIKVYSGTWKNNKKDGSGTFYYSSTAWYEGEWLENERSGTGTINYENGDKYVGEWLRGKPNGKGVLSYKNGNRYEGSMKDGKKHGFGRFIYKDRGRVYEGYWEYDMVRFGIMCDDKKTTPKPEQHPIPTVMLQDVSAVMKKALSCFCCKKQEE